MKKVPCSYPGIGTHALKRIYRFTEAPDITKGGRNQSHQIERCPEIPKVVIIITFKLIAGAQNGPNNEKIAKNKNKKI